MQVVPMMAALLFQLHPIIIMVTAQQQYHGNPEFVELNRQNICAAPAVKAMIFIRPSYRALKRPAGVEMVEQVAFVGLIPTDAMRGNRAQVQAADIGGGEQAGLGVLSA